MTDNQYVGTRRISYDCEEDGLAQFIPVCSTCGRYVKSNEVISLNPLGDLIDEPNAVCSKCGPTFMLFEGFF